MYAIAIDAPSFGSNTVAINNVKPSGTLCNVTAKKFLKPAVDISIFCAAVKPVCSCHVCNLFELVLFSVSVGAVVSPLFCFSVGVTSIESFDSFSTVSNGSFVSFCFFVLQTQILLKKI